MSSLTPADLDLHPSRACTKLANPSLAMLGEKKASLREMPGRKQTGSSHSVPDEPASALSGPGVSMGGVSMSKIPINAPPGGAADHARHMEPLSRRVMG
eukprot:gene454-4486_t